jgi:outer membrane biosynthesis protein TonB
MLVKCFIAGLHYTRMASYAPSMAQNQGRLWLISFLVSLIVCLLGFLLFGLLSLSSLVLSHAAPITRAVEEQIVIIMAPKLQTPAAVAAVTPTAPTQKQFTRTSADQESAPPTASQFIGDRDTTATSDAAPIPGAPELPSQSGRDPRNPHDIETTQSRTQAGALEHQMVAKNTPTPPSPTQPTPPPAEVTPAETLPKPVADDITQKEQLKIPEQKMLTGDQPTERNLPKEEIKPKEKQQTAELPKPKQDTPDAAAKDPGFRGNQEKTKLSGSISRKGKSALNVTNTAMGRYQAALSRAIEAEWNANCTKYRDFITPGILTLRFVIDENGKVRSVNVVEMIDAGEIQKGFTLNSIRQAKLPSIPNDLKKELDGEPIELLYNFYF